MGGCSSQLGVAFLCRPAGLPQPPSVQVHRPRSPGPLHTLPPAHPRTSAHHAPGGNCSKHAHAERRPGSAEEEGPVGSSQRAPPAASDYNSRHAPRAPARGALPEVELGGGVSDLSERPVQAGIGREESAARSPMPAGRAADGFAWRRRLRGRHARGGPASPAALPDRGERRHRQRQGEGPRVTAPPRPALSGRGPAPGLRGGAGRARVSGAGSAALCLLPVHCV